MAIPIGITVDDVLRAIHEYERGSTPHRFGPSRDYDLVFEGKTYPPKAIVGLASRRLNGGEALTPDDFSGGEASSAANRVLRRLDFVVVDKPTSMTVASSGQRIDWEDWEITIAIDAYLDLLHSQIEGIPVVKKAIYSEVARRLRPERRDKPKSVEFKFQNISAVLEQEQLRWVPGLKPKWNYQHALERAVVARLDAPGGERQYLESVGQAWQAQQTKPAGGNLEVEPPDLEPRLSDHDRKPVVRRSLASARRDEANRQLGRKGEEWACEYERARLARAERPRLADQVEWVADTQGDGLGYDVVSYSMSGEVRLLEVKTTGAAKLTPFVLTPNERRVWEADTEHYRVFRIFDFGDDPHFYRLRGRPEEVAHLSTALWEVRPSRRAESP